MFRFGDPGGRVYGSVGTSNINIAQYWSQVSGIATIIVSAGNGRNIGSCLRITSTSSSHSLNLMKIFDNQSTWGIAFALKYSILPTVGGAGYAPIIQINDVSSIQIDLRINTDGSLTVTRNGTTLGTVSPGIAAATWYHIELKTTIHPTSGTIGLWLNGVQKLNLINQNTRATTNSSANVIYVGEIINNSWGNNSVTIDLDDIIIYDGQTTDSNGLADITGPIGDCGLSWLVPSGAGTTTQYTPDSGSNYARVNEATIDTTSYVESSTVNQIDTYTLGDLPATAASVKSVAVVHNARKTDVGSRGMKAQIHSGGTDYTHATEVALSDSYVYYMNNWGQNPNTSAAWTVSDVNALEAGQKVSS